MKLKHGEKLCLVQPYLFPQFHHPSSHLVVTLQSLMWVVSYLPSMASKDMLPYCFLKNFPFQLFLTDWFATRKGSDKPHIPFSSPHPPNRPVGGNVLVTMMLVLSPFTSICQPTLGNNTLVSLPKSLHLH